LVQIPLTEGNEFLTEKTSAGNIIPCKTSSLLSWAPASMEMATPYLFGLTCFEDFYSLHTALGSRYAIELNGF